MQKLEGYRGFRFVAWALVIGFFLFTLHLAERIAAIDVTTGAETEAAISDLEGYLKKEE